MSDTDSTTVADLASRGTDAIAHGMESARQYALERRDRAQELAHEADLRAHDYAERVGTRALESSRTAADFVSRHAVPLTFVGVSLGFLFWSVRREASLREDARRLPTSRTYARRLPRLHAPYADERQDLHDHPEHRYQDVPASARTTTGDKLIGVPTTDPRV